jgi:mRNA-degrading endonuclease YafQ of YafQ-DinJ toxin-antitoxin module
LVSEVRTAVRSGQFRRDVKRAARRGKDMTKLRELIRLLLAGGGVARARVAQLDHISSLI